MKRVVCDIIRGFMGDIVIFFHASLVCLMQYRVILYHFVLGLQGPLLLIWTNFDTSMDKYSHAQESVGWN